MVIIVNHIYDKLQVCFTMVEREHNHNGQMIVNHVYDKQQVYFKTVERYCNHNDKNTWSLL